MVSHGFISNVIRVLKGTKHHSEVIQARVKVDYSFAINFECLNLSCLRSLRFYLLDQVKLKRFFRMTVSVAESVAIRINLLTIRFPLVPLSDVLVIVMS